MSKTTSVATKIKIFFGVVWILAALNHFFQLISNAPSAKYMFEHFAEDALIPAYIDYLIVPYFIPMAVFFVALASTIMIITGSLMLFRKRTPVRIGLASGIAMCIIMAPLGIYPLMINTVFVIFHVWLWKKI